MRRRSLLPLLAIALLTASCRAGSPSSATPRFEIVEATIPQMREAMEQGRADIARAGRDVSGAHRHVSADAERRGLRQRERAEGGRRARSRARRRASVRGPLHGIPIALKDNIHTTNMPTSGGALAFDGFIPPYEATLTKNLIDGRRDHHRQDRHVGAGRLHRGRADAGARRLQRAWRTRLQSVRSAARPAAGDGGRTAGAEPGRLELGQRHGGQSVGREHRHRNVGVDSRPVESVAMLAAVKPTVGRVSRWGVIPITADQDTAGPMARTVTDAAILLGALEGTSARSERCRDLALHAAGQQRLHPFLKTGCAARRAHRHSARVLLRQGRRSPAARRPRGGLNPAQAKAMADAIDGSESSRAPSSSIRRTSRASSIPIRRRPSSTGTSAAAPTMCAARTPAAPSS